ncbi:MAG: Polyketide cyclase/dehydrase [Pseudonocardia sp.]|nr:Polyketide cyclase/dehydrase [Pseudonocardia sp.]
MAQLTATAVAMIKGTVEKVHTALTDYESVRPLLLTENFDDYQVRSGGHGAGTEVGWTLLVSEKRRRRRLKLRRQVPWDCLVRVDEATEDRIVERDLRSALVTTWTVRDAGEGRTVVRVLASWDGPDGLAGLLSRPRQRLAIRKTYEDMLTNLHNYFDPPKAIRRKSAAADGAESGTAKAETGTPEAEPAEEDGRG